MDPITIKILAGMGVTGAWAMVATRQWIHGNRSHLSTQEQHAKAIQEMAAENAKRLDDQAKAHAESMAKIAATHRAQMDELTNRFVTLNESLVGKVSRLLDSLARSKER